MNREQVMALADEELRVKAAELAGWTQAGVRQFTPTGTPPPGKQDNYRSFEPWYGWCVIPDYPHDIAAAWELFEVMVDKGLLVSIERRYVKNGESVASMVTVQDRDAMDVLAFFIDEGHRWPLMISRAFVLAMTGGPDASK